MWGAVLGCLGFRSLGCRISGLGLFSGLGGLEGLRDLGVEGCNLACCAVAAAVFLWIVAFALVIALLNVCLDTPPFAIGFDISTHSTGASRLAACRGIT